MPPFDNGQNFNIASKDRAEAMSGLRDVLQADAQYSRGEIGAVERLQQDASGLARIVSGSIGSFARSNLYGADSGQCSDVLPSLELSEQSQAMSSGDDVRQIKKEKAAYQQDPQSPYLYSDSDADAGAIRQAKKEDELYMTQTLGSEYQ